MVAKKPKALSPNWEPRAKGLGSSGSATSVLGCSPSVGSPEELQPPSAAPAEEMGTGRAANADESRAAAPGDLCCSAGWAYPNKPQLDAARHHGASRPAGGRRMCRGRGIPTAARLRGSGVVWPPARPCRRAPGTQPDHAGSSLPASHSPNRHCRLVRDASLGLLEAVRMAGATGQGHGRAEGAPEAAGEAQGSPGAGACPEAQAAWRALQSRSESWRGTRGWSRSWASGSHCRAAAPGCAASISQPLGISGPGWGLPLSF